MPATPPPPDGPVATDALRAAPSGAAAGPEPGGEGSATPDPVLRAAISRHPASRRPDVIRLPEGRD
jgi:hypothetical protein